MSVFESMTPAERVLRARIAVHTSWANTPDRAARTRHGTEALLARFERQVDPEGVLEPAERERRVESAKRAYFSALALKGMQARRRNAKDPT